MRRSVDPTERSCSACSSVPAAKTANPKDFMDTSFLEELDKSGYIDGLYR